MTRLPLPPIDELYAQLHADGYKPVKEYRFDAKRRWRFDLALPSHKLACEYEGIYDAKDDGRGRRHLTVKGYAEDCHKYNAALLAGWRVLRFTAGDFDKSGYALSTVLSALKGEV